MLKHDVFSSGTITVNPKQSRRKPEKDEELQHPSDGLRAVSLLAKSHRCAGGGGRRRGGDTPLCYTPPRGLFWGWGVKSDFAGVQKCRRSRERAGSDGKSYFRLGSHLSHFTRAWLSRIFLAVFYDWSCKPQIWGGGRGY